jgi:O-antigen ligase
MSTSGRFSDWSLTRLIGASGLGAHALLWLALWSSIASGPGNIVGEKEGLAEWLNAVRASMPLVVLALWFVLRPMQSGRVGGLNAGLVMWAAYGSLMLFSSFQYSHWFIYGYWALAYLSVMAAIDITLGSGSASRAVDMVRLNWIMATGMLIVMLFLARDVLLVESKLGLTAYNLDMRAGVRGGIPISKTSGLARMAIVPAVVGFVLVLRSVGMMRLLGGAVFLGAVIMIWFFQSRQGIFGMAFALGFVMVALGGGTRILGIATMIVMGALLFAGLLPDEVVDYVARYATRGEGLQAFESMTGRDMLWRLGWRAVEDSPWIGYGPEADRRILLLNASNGLLYAGMCAGYPGAALYLGGLIWGWVLFARAYVQRMSWRAEERDFLVQLGGVMAFLTLRNVVENTASFYSVDLLLHAPMIACLGVLLREHRRRGARAGAWSAAPVPGGGPVGGRVAPAAVRESRGAP